MRFLLQVVILFAIVSAVLSIVRGALAPSSPRRPVRPGDRSTGHLVKDPVCGTYVPKDTAVRHQNEYFCSDDCRRKFLA